MVQVSIRHVTVLLLSLSVMRWAYAQLPGGGPLEEYHVPGSNVTGVTCNTTDPNTIRFVHLGAGGVSAPQLVPFYDASDPIRTEYQRLIVNSSSFFIYQLHIINYDGMRAVYGCGPVISLATSQYIILRTVSTAPTGSSGTLEHSTANSYQSISTGTNASGCLNETYSFSGALSPVHHSSFLKVVTAKTNLAVIFNEANPSGPAVDHTTMTEDGQFLAFQQLLCRVNNNTSGTATTPQLCPTSPQSSVTCSMTYYYNLHGIYAGGLYVGTQFRTIDSFSGDQGHGRNWTKSTIQADFPSGTPIEFVFNFTCNPNPVMDPLVFSQVTQGIVAIDDITVVCDCSGQQAASSAPTVSSGILEHSTATSYQSSSTENNAPLTTSPAASSAPTVSSGILEHSTATSYQSSSTENNAPLTTSPVQSNEQPTTTDQTAIIIYIVAGLAGAIIMTFLAFFIIVKMVRSRSHRKGTISVASTVPGVECQSTTLMQTQNPAFVKSTTNPAYGVSTTGASVPSNQAARSTGGNTTSTNNELDLPLYVEFQ